MLRTESTFQTFAASVAFVCCLLVVGSLTRVQMTTLADVLRTLPVSVDSSPANWVQTAVTISPEIAATVLTNTGAKVDVPAMEPHVEEISLLQPELRLVFSIELPACPLTDSSLEGVKNKGPPAREV